MAQSGGIFDWKLLFLLDLTVPLEPINAHSDQKQPDKFDKIFQAKAYLGKYLKEKYFSDQYQQLSFKYFVKSLSTPKLLSKVSLIKTTIAISVDG